MTLNIKQEKSEQKKQANKNKRQKEIKEHLSTIKDDSAFILYFYDKHQLLRNNFPEITSFNDFVSTFKTRIGSKRKESLLELNKEIFFKLKVSNQDGFVMNYSVPEALSIDKDIYQKIYKKKLFIEPAGFESFQKWGKTLETPYFNFDELMHFKTHKMRAVLSSLNLDSEAERRIEYTEYCEKVATNFAIDCFSPFDQPENKTYRYRMNFSLNGDVKEVEIVFKNPITLKAYVLGELDKSVNTFKEFLASCETKSNALKQKIENHCKAGDFFLEELLNHQEVSKFLNKKSGIDFLEMEFAVNEFIKNKFIENEGSKLKDTFDLNNYHNTFHEARSIKRDIQIICGPTNSGKTHEAIESLKDANSGVYLAPLRLMALEIFDKLNEAGVRCSLMTGDDEIIIPGARHISSTIECLDTSKSYDVAVIDEFQMLEDVDRGWAWTQAILGVCAKKVFIIGSDIALNSTLKALSQVDGDTVEVKKLERHSNLSVIKEGIKFKSLKAGDALIAFSRKEVLAWAYSLEASGFSVSVIYGALAPEVRRKQAKMFLDGETDILVSTDAIGMGLNLPIDRIIFTTLSKFDGISNRLLNPQEIKQIAGRAGRYKKDGFVCLISDNPIKEKYGYDDDREPTVSEGIKIIKDGLDVKNHELKALRIAPNSYHLKTIAKALSTNELLPVLNCFKHTVRKGIYIPTYQYGIYEIVSAINKKFSTLDIFLQYKLANTPVDINKQNMLLERVVQIIESTFLKQIKSNHLDWIEETYGLEDSEIEMKMITALIHLAKKTDLIDIEGLFESRDLIAKKINDILVKRLYRNEQSKLSYQEKQKRDLERMEARAKRKALEKAHKISSFSKVKKKPTNNH